MLFRSNDKLATGNLTDEQTESYKKLRGQLETAKIRIDKNSRLDNQHKIEIVPELLSKIEDKAPTEFQKDIHFLSRDFMKDKERTETEIKLEKTKKNLQQQINRYEQRINAGDFAEAKKPITTTKDAE